MADESYSLKINNQILCCFPTSLLKRCVCVHVLALPGCCKAGSQPNGLEHIYLMGVVEGCRECVVYGSAPGNKPTAVRAETRGRERYGRGPVPTATLPDRVHIDRCEAGRGTKLFSCSRGSSWAPRRLGRNDSPHASGRGGGQATDSSRHSVGLAPNQFKKETPFVTLSAGLWADFGFGHLEMPTLLGNILVRS